MAEPLSNMNGPDLSLLREAEKELEIPAAFLEPEVMNILYIIGNGFDLWHELPTKFAQFYNFAQETLEEIEQYLSLDSADQNLWNDFERTIGKYDWKSFYDAHNNLTPLDDSFRPSMCFGLEDDIKEQTDNLVTEIKQQFFDWINSIDLDGVTRKLEIEPNSSSKFFSFNYTNTLEQVYGVDKTSIFYIHGNVHAYDDLIFGHGETMVEEPEIDENGDSNRTMFTDSENAAKYPFYAFHKPVKEIIENNSDYFDSLGNIDTIIVIGHSVNDIDLPYFHKIAEITKAQRWIVSYFNDDEPIRQIEKLKKCGINVKTVYQCHIDNINACMTKIS